MSIFKRNFFSYFFIVAILILVPEVLNAQLIKAVLPVGLNFTQVDGDEVAGYNKVGLNTGVGAMIDLDESENWEIGFEILYNRLGSKSTAIQSRDLLGGFDLKLQYDYVSIPILVNYKDIGNGYLGAGIMISRLVNAKRFENKIQVPNIESLKSMDYGVFGQLGFVFSPNFRVTLRAGYSAVKFFNSTLRGRAHHNYVTLRFDTILNGLIKLGR